MPAFLLWLMKNPSWAFALLNLFSASLSRRNTMTVKLNNNSNDFLKSFISNVERTNDTVSERKTPQIYINIGFYSNQLKDNDGNPLFISLPYGLPLDTMNDIKVGSGKSSFTELCRMKNSFKKELLKKLESVPEGTAIELPFTIQVFKAAKANEQAEINTSEIDDMMNKIKF